MSAPDIISVAAFLAVLLIVKLGSIAARLDERPHPETDAREVYYEPDPEVERLKAIRSRPRPRPQSPRYSKRR